MVRRHIPIDVGDGVALGNGSQVPSGTSSVLWSLPSWFQNSAICVILFDPHNHLMREVGRAAEDTGFREVRDRGPSQGSHELQHPSGATKRHLRANTTHSPPPLVPHPYW